MLATPYEAFHLDFVLKNLCRGEIPDEWFSPVYAGGLAMGFSSFLMDGLTRS
jgi:hypothetical protein